MTTTELLAAFESLAALTRFVTESSKKCDDTRGTCDALEKVTNSAVTLLRDMEALQSVERSVAKHDGNS